MRQRAGAEQGKITGIGDHRAVQGGIVGQGSRGSTIVGVEGIVEAIAVGVGSCGTPIGDAVFVPIVALEGIGEAVAIAVEVEVVGLTDAIAVVAGGGAVIEWWGTNTELWWYFTQERPPPWILPAWPVAALAIDRLCRISCARLPRLGQSGWLYWGVVPVFVVLMTRFLWPSIHEPASWIVIALMLLVMTVGVKKDRDVALFLVGAAAGIFLEYWGTSRRCWTYYTHQAPPLEAILAHGFASIAFARGADLMAQRGSLLLWMRSSRSTATPDSSPSPSSRA